MKLTFLSVQATYAHVHIELFQNEQCIDRISKQDVRASSHLIPYFDEILKRNNVSLEQLNFLAVDRGPGAFTSLRTAIATVNGIGATRKVQLIGVESLQALTLDAQEELAVKSTVGSRTAIIALLNAYNNDVYYAISILGSKGEILQDQSESGYKKINDLLATISSDTFPEIIVLIGNGVLLHQEAITTQLKNKLLQIISQETPTAGSIAHLAAKSYQQDTTPCYRIEPNYVKSQYFAVQPPVTMQQT